MSYTLERDWNRVVIGQRLDDEMIFVRWRRTFKKYETLAEAEQEAVRLQRLWGPQVTIDNRIGQITESTIRRRADRAGYSLIKSRKVEVTPEDQGEYMLIDAGTRFPVCGHRYDADLAEIALFLSSEVEAA